MSKSENPIIPDYVIKVEARLSALETSQEWIKQTLAEIKEKVDKLIPEKIESIESKVKEYLKYMVVTILVSVVVNIILRLLAL